jgi:ABC-2 type transport system permease protein
MRGLAGVYAQQFRITLASFVQYRASIFIWMIGGVLEPVIYLVVWSVVSRTRGGAVGGFRAEDFAAYFIAMMLVNHFTYTWIIYEFEYRIRHGSLSIALLRPLHPIHSDIVDNVTSKLISVPLLAGTALILTLLFRPAFHISPWALAAFVPALLLAFAVRFLIEWTLALAAFWTVRVSAINQGYFVVVLFLSGQVAPLSLLPDPLQVAAAILPFRWILYFPVELLLGRLTPAETLTGLSILLGWLAAALILLAVVWRAGVRVYSAVGT